MSPLPLEGRAIVVTRARSQAADLGEALAALGAEVLYFPVIKTVGPDSWEAVDAAARGLASYDWVLFTSANAVGAFLDRLGRLGIDPSALGQSMLAAVGPATARRLREHGLEPALVPDDHVAEGLLQALVSRGVGAGSRVLLPRASEARDVLPDDLRGRGAVVDVVPVYRTVTGDGDPAVAERLRAGGADVVTFTSSSTVSRFLELAGDAAEPRERPGFLTASIGPVTSETLRAAGLPVDIEASPSTVADLAAAIATRFEAAAG